MSRRFNTGPALEASLRMHAERAVDDPAKLAKAARIIKAALARGAITLSELTPFETDGGRTSA